MEVSLVPRPIPSFSMFQGTDARVMLGRSLVPMQTREVHEVGSGNETSWVDEAKWKPKCCTQCTKIKASSIKYNTTACEVIMDWESIS